MREVTRFEPWRCSNCGYLMDAATDASGKDAVPAEGDLSVCTDCAELHILHDNRWRPLTDDELIELPLEDKKHASAVQKAIREFNKEQRRKR